LKGLGQFRSRVAISAEPQERTGQFGVSLALHARIRSICQELAEMIDGRFFLPESGLDQRAVVTHLPAVAVRLRHNPAKIENALGFLKLPDVIVVRGRKEARED
jgi:hypothetical protein